MDVAITINGKPATEANIRNELEKAVFDAAVASVKEKIASVITPTEAQEITVDVKGSSVDNLSFEIKGPEEIVEKVMAVFRDDETDES